MKKSSLPRPVLWLCNACICAMAVILILFTVLRLRAPEAFPTLVPENCDTVLIFDDYGGMKSLQGDEAVQLVRQLWEKSENLRGSYHTFYPRTTIALYSGGELLHTFYHDPVQGRLATYPYFRQLKSTMRACDDYFSPPTGGGTLYAAPVPTAELIRSATFTRGEETIELTPEQIATLPELWAQLDADGVQVASESHLFSMDFGDCLTLQWGEYITVELRERQLPYNTFVHIRYHGTKGFSQIRYRLPAGYDLFAELG